MSEPKFTLIVGGRRGPGRPALYGNRASHRIEFVVTAEQRRELSRVASECGKSLATVIREAVNEYVEDYRERKVFE